MSVALPTLLLAATVGASWAIIAPLERRTLSRTLRTTTRLRLYGVIVASLWALASWSIWATGWTPIFSPFTAGLAELPVWLWAPLGLFCAGYFVLALSPAVQGLRGRPFRVAVSSAIRRQGAAFPGLLPQGRVECIAFSVVALSAGFCEEIVFRGFAPIFIQSHLADNVWLALAATSGVFGLHHAYQGFKGVLSTAIAGLAFGLVTLLSGSLAPAIVLHVLMDLQLAFLLWPDSVLHDRRTQPV